MSKLREENKGKYIDFLVHLGYVHLFLILSPSCVIILKLAFVTLVTCVHHGISSEYIKKIVATMEQSGVFLAHKRVLSESLGFKLAFHMSLINPGLYNNHIKDKIWLKEECICSRLPNALLCHGYMGLLA